MTMGRGLGRNFTIEEYLAAVLADLRAYFPGQSPFPDTHIVHMAGYVRTLTDSPPYIFLRLADVASESQSLARCTIEASLHWQGPDGAGTALELISWAHRRMGTHLGQDVRMEPGYMSQASGLYVWPVMWDILCPYDYELRPVTDERYRVRKISVELRSVAEVPLGRVDIEA